jgi:hypothetical protein
MAFGQTKDCSLKFVNSTGMTINVPREGHRVKNPGGLEGWNKMQLGTAINSLAPDDDRTVTQDLNIKAVDDATAPRTAATSRSCSATGISGTSTPS